MNYPFSIITLHVFPVITLIVWHKATVDEQADEMIKWRRKRQALWRHRKLENYIWDLLMTLQLWAELGCLLAFISVYIMLNLNVYIFHKKLSKALQLRRFFEFTRAYTDQTRLRGHAACRIQRKVTLNKQLKNTCCLATDMHFSRGGTQILYLSKSNNTAVYKYLVTLLEPAS